MTYVQMQYFPEALLSMIEAFRTDLHGLYTSTVVSAWVEDENDPHDRGFAWVLIAWVDCTKSLCMIGHVFCTKDNLMGMVQMKS